MINLFVILVLGIIYIAIALFFLFSFEHYNKMISDLEKNPKFIACDSALTYVAGFILILVGLSGVGWQYIVIEILGSIALLKGFFMILNPGYIVKIMKFCSKPFIFSIFLVTILVLGIFMSILAVYLYFLI